MTAAGASAAARIDKRLSGWAHCPTTHQASCLVDAAETIRRLPFMSPYRSIFAPGLLRGQVALVTGGGSGIGRCTAHELAALGAAVAIVGRNADKLDGGAARDRGRRRHLLDPRLRHPRRSAGAATVAAVIARHGRIDALVNNAGGQFHAPLAAISAKGWDAVVRNNLTGGFLFARECVDQWMLKTPAHAAAAERRRDRQHHRRHVGRHAGHGPLGRGARRHAQLHRDGGARVGAGARQRGRAGLDRVERAWTTTRPRWRDSCAA